MTTLNIAAPANGDAPVQSSLPVVTSVNQPAAINPSCRTQATDVQAQKEAYKAKQGRFAWLKLHAYTGCDPQWLDIWQYLIPARCDCKDGYQQILGELPPDFASPETFFAWGVGLHNAINRKLGKPELTIEEALSIWRKPDGLDMQETESERT